MDEQTTLVTNSNSKGFMLDYMEGSVTAIDNKLGQVPKFDPAKVRKVIENDPVVRAAIITMVDKVFESDYAIFKNKKINRELTLKFKKFQHMRKLAFNLVLYNNAFLEIVGQKLEDKIDASDLNVLEVAYTRIKTDQHGDIIEYFQEAGFNRDDPSWSTDRIVQYKIDDYTSNTWSEMTIASIYETCLIKDYIRKFLMWFYRTNQNRPIINIQESAAKVKVEEFLSYMKKAERTPELPHVFEGKVVVQMLQSLANEGKTILDFVNWCNSEILMALQMPPIAVGMADQSGRSNSVEQYAALNTRALSFQRVQEDITNFVLLPRLKGFEEAELRFGVLDETARSKVFEIVEKMRNAQFTEDAILEYMASQRIVFETEKVLKSPEEIAMMSNKDLGTGNEGIKGNKSADSAPSRARQSDANVSKANQSKMVRNSNDTPFGNYPYTF